MKKIKQKICSFLLVFLLSIIPLTTSSYAQTGYSGCIGKYKCYGCNKYNCEVHKVKKITTYFSNSECKKVIKRADTTSSIAVMAGFFAGTFSSVQTRAAGILFELYGNSVDNVSKIFKRAVARGKGLEISYEYVITKVNASSFGRKGSYRFR